MARKPTQPASKSATFTADEVRAGIAAIQRRIADVENFDISKIYERSAPETKALQVSIAETLERVFGRDSSDFQRYRRAALLDQGPIYVGRGGTPPHLVNQYLSEGKASALALLKQAVRGLGELVGDEDSGSLGVLRAYEGLELHPEIARAASDLYRNGHYANAIEDAVKALNALVRMRSGKDDLDGTSLMQHVFSQGRPVLRFNDLADQSDRDEQQGFMMMFSGAVAGLRNPRAHRLIKDDPERALEFIAYISLLAKLLDGAKKVLP